MGPRQIETPTHGGAGRSSESQYRVLARRRVSCSLAETLSAAALRVAWSGLWAAPYVVTILTWLFLIISITLRLVSTLLQSPSLDGTPASSPSKSCQGSHNRETRVTAGHGLHGIRYWHLAVSPIDV